MSLQASDQCCFQVHRRVVADNGMARSSYPALVRLFRCKTVKFGCELLRIMRHRAGLGRGDTHEDHFGLIKMREIRCHLQRLVQAGGVGQIDGHHDF